MSYKDDNVDIKYQRSDKDMPIVGLGEDLFFYRTNNVVKKYITNIGLSSIWMKIFSFLFVSRAKAILKKNILKDSKVNNRNSTN